MILSFQLFAWQIDVPIRYLTYERWRGQSIREFQSNKRSVRVTELLALLTSDHEVSGSNPTGSKIISKPKRRFIAFMFPLPSSWYDWDTAEKDLKSQTIYPSISQINIQNNARPRKISRQCGPVLINCNYLFLSCPGCFKLFLNNRIRLSSSHLWTSAVWTQ